MANAEYLEQINVAMRLVIRDFAKMQASKGDQFKQVRYYENVGVITYGGVPMMPINNSITPDLAKEYLYVEMYNSRLHIVMSSNRRIVLIPENSEQEIISLTGDVMYFRHVGVLNDGEFIEMPNARYYSGLINSDVDHVTFYTEHFEVIRRLPAQERPLIYINEITHFATFEKCTVINGFMLSVGGVEREGNWIYGAINKRKFKALNPREFPENKCAITFWFGDVYIHDGRNSIRLFRMSTYDKGYVPLLKLQYAEQCKHVYGIDKIYIGKTHDGDFIQLYPRSENSGYRTKPAIRADFDDASAEEAA